MNKTQREVLDIIITKKRTYQNAIVKELSGRGIEITHPAVSRHVTQLEKLRYIETTIKGSRKIILPTPLGGAFNDGITLRTFVDKLPSIKDTACREIIRQILQYDKSITKRRFIQDLTKTTIPNEQKITLLIDMLLKDRILKEVHERIEISNFGRGVLFNDENLGRTVKKEMLKTARKTFGKDIPFELDEFIKETIEDQSSNFISNGEIVINQSLHKEDREFSDILIDDVLFKKIESALVVVVFGYIGEALLKGLNSEKFRSQESQIYLANFLEALAKRIRQDANVQSIKTTKAKKKARA